jgi:hypothetical protein
MTQQEIDRATSVINEANTQLLIAMDKLDTQERIIKAQDEMIEILKSNVTSRDKYIAILEKQLALQDNALVRESKYSRYIAYAKSLEEPDYDMHIDDPREHATRLMTPEEFQWRLENDNKFNKRWEL